MLSDIVKVLAVAGGLVLSSAPLAATESAPASSATPPKPATGDVSNAVSN